MQTSSVDMVFMLDCTGSMGPYINSTKNDINTFARKICELHHQINLRLAFVGYRDHCDGSNRLSVLRFTKSVDDFTSFVSSQSATGGGDSAEDVAGGLNVVKGLEWESQTRIVYHICDAPCHGSHYHTSAIDDNNMNGDPNGLDIAVILRELQMKNVQYYFGKINDHTNLMIQRFNEHIGGEFVTTTPLNSGSMMTTITTSVTKSVSESISGSASTESGKHLKREVTLDASEPTWSALAFEDVLRFSMTMPTNIEEIIEVLDPLHDKAIGDFPDAGRCRLRMARSPFAKGAMRAASYAQLDNGTKMIVKESLYLSESLRTLDKYDAMLQNHRIAKFLSTKFNEVKPGGTSAVDFCEGCIIQCMSRPGQPIMVLEANIPGLFEKFNNNTGFCAPNPTLNGRNHDAVQAFSHWSHHITRGQMLVVDCQGGFDAASNRFVLTDPAVHCSDLSRFGNTNLGPNGIRHFFQNHKCNGVCRAMGLSMPSL